MTQIKCACGNIARKAQVLVRPALYINDTPATVAGNSRKDTLG